MTAPAVWSTAGVVVRAVRRRWSDGTLLRAFAAGAEFPRIEVPLQGPNPADVGDHFDAARSWAAGLYRAGRDGAAYELELRRVGGRLVGRTELPGRAVVTRYEQAWRLLGVAEEVAAFARVCAVAEALPAAHEWVLQHPLAAIEFADEWPAVLAAHRWLDDHRGSGLFLRTISAPGVDTKFVDRHRAVLAALLAVPSSKDGFTAALGLAAKPITVRFRLDPALLGLPAPITEVVLRIGEVRRLAVRPTLALLVENEITYLSTPVPDGGVVLWGKGYDVGTPATLDWLVDVPVVYWGDLDTHGFAILDRLRAHLPQTRSILMDRGTLLAHEDRWGREQTPTNVRLSRLGTEEYDLYTDLVTDRFGAAVRLEQERIDWTWAQSRFDWVR